MEHHYFLYIFSGNAKLISCLTIAFLVLAALFTYLSYVQRHTQPPAQPEPYPQPIQKQQIPTATVEKSNHLEHINRLEQEKNSLTEEILALRQKCDELQQEFSDTQQESRAIQKQIPSLQRTIKSLYTTYQNLLNRYEEAQRAHLFELKTLFKKTTPATTPEISSLFTFHRQLKTAEEQLYFLASLMDKDASKEGSSMLSSLQALNLRRRLKVLDMYQDIPWMLLNPLSGEIEGTSKSCPKPALSEKNLLKEPLQTSEYELFHIELGGVPCTGFILDKSQTHALLVSATLTL